MPLAVHWDKTTTQPRGRQTEVMVPLSGVEEVEGFDQGIVVQTIGDAAKGDARRGVVVAFDQVTVDFETGTLHLNASSVADVPRIKAVVNQALVRANELLLASRRQREHMQAQAKQGAERREQELTQMRDAFRAP